MEHIGNSLLIMFQVQVGLHHQEQILLLTCQLRVLMVQAELAVHQEQVVLAVLRV